MRYGLLHVPLAQGLALFIYNIISSLARISSVQVLQPLMAILLTSVLPLAAREGEGEANKAVKDVVSDILGVPKSSVEIIKGHKSRERPLRYLGSMHVGMLMDVLPNLESFY